MSTINFRLYGDQIYGLALSKLKDRITPEIEKEAFTKMFQDGEIKYDNIQNKEKIVIHPQMTIDNLQIEKIILNIPNETENFSVNLSGVKTTIELFDIKESEIENIIIQKRKDLIEQFIAYAVKKIENKESSKSFIEGLIENLINRAINGLKIEINNVELRIKYKKHTFVLSIENISYSEENGIQIKNTAILYEEEGNLNKKNYIINQFNIGVELKPAQNESECNEINIKLSDFQFELTKDIFLAFNEMFNLIEETKYKNVYIRYKKLIQYHRPKKPEISENDTTEENDAMKEKNKYYNLLWLYAIKAVIKLQKYVGYDKLYLFDLLNSTQEKIAKNYLDDNSNTEKLILPTEISLLKATKEKVEQKVLDGKKGNVLSNAFSFFFGGNKDEEEKKELSEEERKIFEDIFTDEYLIKYLYSNNKDDKSQSNPIKDKIIAFILKLKININFNKLELILANDDVNKCTLYISNIKLEIEKENSDINSVLTIENIGSNLDESLFSEKIKINENNDLIMISRDKNNKINVNLGFKNIDLSEDLFNFILIFFSSLKITKKNRIFKNINYEIKTEEKKTDETNAEEAPKEEDENAEEEKNAKKEKENGEEEKNEEKENNDKVEEENKNENEKKESNNENDFFKNFSINIIPSLVISSNGNKTFFSLTNFSLTPTEITATYNIKDSYGTILDNYTFLFNKDTNNNKYILNLKEPLKIKLSSESSKFLFISILKLTERLNQIKKRNKIKKQISSNANSNENNDNSEEEKELFGFNYVIHKRIDIKNFNINELKIEVLMKKILIEIYENNVRAKFCIHNFHLTYENKELMVKIEKISIKNNLMSTMLIYMMGFEAPNFNEFKKYIDEIKNQYKDSENNDVNLVQNDVNNNEGSIKYDFNIDFFLSSFKVLINLVKINFQSGDNIISYSFNKIDIQKADENISVKLGLISLGFMKDDKNSQNSKIFNVDEETSIKFDPKKNLVQVRLTTPKVNADLETLKAMQKSMEYLMVQVDFEIILCKADVQIFNGKINLNNEFNISIPKILLKNFDEKSNNTVYLTINDLEVKNKNNEIITGQKSININITTKSITEYSFLLNFSDLNINLSKNDIEALLKIVNRNKNKENPNKQLKSEEKNPAPSAQKESHEYKISVELNIPLFDFSICTEENRNKICELFLLRFGTKANIYIPADIGQTHNMNDIKRNINVFLGKLKLIYHNENNNEFNIIEYKEKNKFEKILHQKSMISFEQNLNKQNLIEINLNNEIDKNINDIEININRLGINIKLDILVNLLLYIKGLLPKNVINNENVNEPKEIEVNNKEGNKERQSEIKLNLNLNETEFKLESINTGEKIILIYINKFNYIFNSIKDKKLPLGNNEINLDKLSIILINNEENINILETKNDFILIKANLNEEIPSVDINCKEMMINLSYSDINLINNIISSNIAYLKAHKDQLIKSGNKIQLNESNENKLLSLKYNLKGLDFILIDNYSNICHPFINLKLNNLSSFLNEKKAINSSVYLTLSTYNYISFTWEPIIENSCISSLFIRKKDNNSMINSIKIEIYKLLLNISDMFISSTVLSLNNLKKALEENKTAAKKSEKDLSQSKVSLSMISAVSSLSNKDIDVLPSKIQTNNKVINCTGKHLKIIFNKKIYESDPSSEVELEYINKWENYQDKKKIKVLYDNNEIDISFTKLGVDSYKLKDNKFLVWENIVSKDRQINILLYSQIILKNKTNYTFQIKATNEVLGNYFILLKQNSISGIPLEFCNNNTSFVIKKVEKDLNSDSFEENNNRVDLSDIIGKDKYQKKLNFNNSISLLMQMNKKIDNVSTLLITSEFSIVNCLPCDMKLEVKNRIEKIRKCSQFFVDFCEDSDLDIKLIIKIGQEYYFSNNAKFSKLKNDFDNNKGKSTIIFKNHKDQSFNLSYFLKDKDYHKSLIIYSEYILFNDSGLNLSINSNYLFNIGQNLYLISNKINLEESGFQVFNNDFSSPNINLQEMVKASPYYKLYLNNGSNIFPLTIKNNISFISIRNNPNFKENIISMVFHILPFCKITNLFSNKKLIIKDNNQITSVPPLNQVSFNFNDASGRKEIELGLLNIKENKCNSSKIFNLFECGIYTFFDENGFYNLEIKDSSSEGVLNIFVTESTLENAKIIAINKTNIDFELSQINYDIYKQVIKGNETQIVKIYDQLYTGFNVKVCGKEFEMKFIAFKEDLQVFQIDRFVLVKESNGVKMKITLYAKEEYDKLNKEDKSFYANLIINNFYISLIGDNLNKNRKLRNYERNEILLLYLQDCDTTLFVNKTKDIIPKNNISLNFNLSKLQVYNQFSKKGLFSCILKNLNSPCMKFTGEFDLYNKDRVVKINKFIYKVNKLKLNIEPEFILKIINFAENIAFRLGKINFNVDKVFLRTRKNYKDIIIKKNKEKYANNQGLICFGSKFNFPSINIDFELTEINLEELLRDKVGCTDLLVWIGFGLVRQNQNIYLERFIINNHFGDFSGLLVKMQNNYKSQMRNVILNIGFKGILGQIKQFFFSGNQTDENSTQVQKNRIRYPRAFYGKYHYIKKYNEEESKIIDKINDLFQNDFKELFCNDILQSKNYIFYFSGSSLFIFTKNYELYYKIDYSNVEKVYNEEENLIVAYKKDNGEENPPSVINCSDVHISKRMIKLFNKYIGLY